MSSLPDYDPERPVPLRFNQNGNRPRSRVGAATPEPANTDLAAELEAALMRDLSVVENALPAAGRRQRRPRPMPIPEPAPAEGLRKPSANMYAPMPKRVQLSTDPVAEPTPPGVPEPVSPYAPPPRRAAPVAREPERSEPPSRRPHPAPIADNSPAPPDWLMSEETDEEPVWGIPAKPVNRPYFAVAALVAVVVCGGAFVALRPAVAPATDPAALPLVTLASTSDAEPASAPAPWTPAPAIVPRTPQQVAEASAAAAPPLVISATAGTEPVAPPPPEVAVAAAAATAAPPGPADQPAQIVPQGAALTVADLAPTLQPNAGDQAVQDPPPVPVVRPPAKKMAAGTASITTAVNMRSGPDNSAAAVKVLNAGAKVSVIRCDLWCEIVAGGQHGYVFKRFLAHG